MGKLVDIELYEMHMRYLREEIVNTPNGAGTYSGLIEDPKNPDAPMRILVTHHFGKIEDVINMDRAFTFFSGEIPTLFAYPIDEITSYKSKP